jgi:predicted dinucleotide-binding enzyme
VVLAVPYPAVAGVLARQGDNLAEKIVVDITNPLNFETSDSLTVPADSSATAEIADALPRPRVLKAFNTTFARHPRGRPGRTADHDRPRRRR